jgi:hypothetical protein
METGRIKNKMRIQINLNKHKLHSPRTKNNSPTHMSQRLSYIEVNTTYKTRSKFQPTTMINPIFNKTSTTDKQLLFDLPPKPSTTAPLWK